MTDIPNFLAHFYTQFPNLKEMPPWEITQDITSLISMKILELNPDDYTVTGGIAIHKTAVIEKGVILKEPLIISENCFVASHAYLRGGVFLGKGTRIGPGCEIKSSIIGDHSATAHFNFIGDSLIGDHVNFEAGALIANHYNERSDKTIWIQINGIRTNTGVIKFGALVGDHSKIGANAVLSPGTILQRKSVVKRLELLEQNN
ncbi:MULTISPECIES: DapH/DapD/GlmU-related protein [unclassified Arenibacter]|uniref:DapH/DapD/GlmU-related protein n=1 Tax=unclassified Arenibacter TaxID=2615047 RepID=UPI000E344B2F|nr:MULTISPECIES: DapH/DapD/GlmU-related protein [unclassified Arenibacter]MCM4162254.1 LpxA family transferase [Arenibacter sp. A80]RFT57860.1 LpxA family transferase [Arenibacter sp. P308M17]